MHIPYSIDPRNYDSASFKNRTFQWNRNISTRSILGSKQQRRSPVKGRQSYKISSMFRCIPPLLKCVRLFRERRTDDSSNRLFTDSCSRENGKGRGENNKIARLNFARVSPRFNDFLSLSFSFSSKFFSVRRPRKISYSPRRRK